MLDVAEQHGCVIGYELHPGSDIYDGATFEMFLDQVDDHPAACINYDPSHFLLQQLDDLKFIQLYGERLMLKTPNFSRRGASASTVVINPGQGEPDDSDHQGMTK